MTAQLRHCLDPEGSLKDANRDYERRHLYLSELLDGMFALHGLIDPEGGSLLRSALKALMGPLQRGDSRTTSQRRADAPEVRPKSPTGPLAPMRPACTRAFCAPHVRIANARAPVLGGPGAFGPPGHQMPRPDFRPHLW